MIDVILAWCDTHEDEVEARAIPEGPFRDMLSKVSEGFPLSEKQVSWVKDTYEKLFDEPAYVNAFSAGTVPLGTALRTPIPEVLKKPLPLKPPRRKIDADR